MGANVKRTWLEVGLRPPKHSHCSVSSLLNLTINTIAINYSGIKFYTSNGYEFNSMYTIIGPAVDADPKC